MDDVITLAHGSGGMLTHQLISDLFYRYFKNDMLLAGGDSAVFPVETGRLAFTTDSYVVSPPFFKGGNIGRLAVCGTINDLSVSGARPAYISCGLILEEGLKIRDLETVVESMADAAKEAGVRIITGDTKVVQKGGADRIFINTSGVGFMPENVQMSARNIREGDKVILSGTMGDHGTAILLEREGLKVKSNIASDCAPLNSLLEPIMRKFPHAVRVMRDPTRGGVATALNELIEGSDFGIILNENIPVQEEVRGICEMLGIDPLYMANEGKVLIIADGAEADGITGLLKENPYGKDAAVIGQVTGIFPNRVYMSTFAGGSRIVDMLSSDPLPRIC